METPPNSGSSSKPKLLFISPKYDGILALNNMEPMVHRIENWLAYFFDVAAVRSECSLAREIEKHRPDLILFDGFIEALHEELFLVSDLSASPEIPRAGICRVDSLSPTRAALFEYFDSVGVTGVFVLGDMTMVESSKEFAKNIFYIPQFVDPAVYRDYGLFKSIPVLLVGTFDSIQYPWRKAVKQPLLDRFPTCYFRHPGYAYDGTNLNPVVIYGEEFAKTVNSALITPTSGGFKNIAVSKHVEIPAARSCLVTDAPDGVKLYGFESFKNCVFATAEEAPDAIDQLLRNRDRLEQITQSGFEFVHQRHTLKQRDQLVDWMNLSKKRRPGEKVVQPDHFGPMQLVPETSPVETLHLGGGDDYHLIALGDEKFKEGKFEESIAFYGRALDLCGYMAEPRLRIAIAQLMLKAPNDALKHLTHNMDWSLKFGRSHSDPLDTAFTMIALLCAGKYPEAANYARLYSRVRRKELDRARWAVFAALGVQESLFDLNLLETSGEPQAPSIHSFPALGTGEQMDQFVRLLMINDQEPLVKNLLYFRKSWEARMTGPELPLSLVSQ